MKFAVCRHCGSAEVVANETRECPGCGALYYLEDLLFYDDDGNWKPKAGTMHETRT